MKSSTVYCKIDNPQRKSDCSFGSAGFTQEICVGTSSSNSHTLANITVEKHLTEDGKGFCFTMFIDGTMVKRVIVQDGESDMIVDLISNPKQ